MAFSSSFTYRVWDHSLLLTDLHLRPFPLLHPSVISLAPTPQSELSIVYGGDNPSLVAFHPKQSSKAALCSLNLSAVFVGSASVTDLPHHLHPLAPAPPLPFWLQWSCSVSILCLEPIPCHSAGLPGRLWSLDNLDLRSHGYWSPLPPSPQWIPRSKPLPVCVTELFCHHFEGRGKRVAKCPPTPPLPANPFCDLRWVCIMDHGSSAKCMGLSLW